MCFFHISFMSSVTNSSLLSNCPPQFSSIACPFFLMEWPVPISDYRTPLFLRFQLIPFPVIRHPQPSNLSSYLACTFRLQQMSYFLKVIGSEVFHICMASFTLFHVQTGHIPIQRLLISWTLCIYKIMVLCSWSDRQYVIVFTVLSQAIALCSIGIYFDVFATTLLSTSISLFYSGSIWAKQRNRENPRNRNEEGLGILAP
jgi:hypothetical protein